MANDIIIRVKGENSNLKTSLEDSKKSIKKFGGESGKSFMNLSNVAEFALGMGVAQMAMRAADAVRQFSMDSVKASLDYERGMISLQLQTKNTADSLISDLKKASDNTVSSLDLINTANRALALGISQNQLPELMEVATARAKVMGITATQAFNDISTGIGRQSKLILDNLGIIMDLDKAYANYAEELGMSVSALSEFDKKAALSNQILKESEGITAALNAVQEDHLTKIARMKVAYEELKLSVGNFAVDVYDFIDEMGRANDEFKDSFAYGEAREELKGLGEEYLSLSKEIQNTQETIKSTKIALDEFYSASRAEGGAKFDVESQKKSNEIDKIKLNIMGFEAKKREDINALVDEGLSQKEAEEWVNKNNLETETELKTLLEGKRAELELYEQQRKVGTENQIALLDKEAKLEMEILEPQEKSLIALKDQFKQLKKNYIQEKENLEINLEKKGVIEDTTTEINKQLKKGEVIFELQKRSLAAEYTRQQYMQGTISTDRSLDSQVSINMRDIDKAFGTLEPEERGVPLSVSAAGMAGVGPTIINYIYGDNFGTDPEQMGDALGVKLRDSINT